jgi:hypothetical protein
MLAFAKECMYVSSAAAAAAGQVGGGGGGGGPTPVGRRKNWAMFV